MSITMDEVAKMSSQKKKDPKYSRVPKECTIISKAKQIMQTMDNMLRNGSAEVGRHALRKSSANRIQIVMMAKKTAKYLLFARARLRLRMDDGGFRDSVLASRTSNIDLADPACGSQMHVMSHCRHGTASSHSLRTVGIRGRQPMWTWRTLWSADLVSSWRKAVSAER